MHLLNSRFSNNFILAFKFRSVSFFLVPILLYAIAFAFFAVYSIIASLLIHGARTVWSH